MSPIDQVDSRLQHDMDVNLDISDELDFMVLPTPTMHVVNPFNEEGMRDAT